MTIYRQDVFPTILLYTSEVKRDVCEFNNSPIRISNLILGKTPVEVIHVE